jgi:hypothetical protein
MAVLAAWIFLSIICIVQEVEILSVEAEFLEHAF